MGHEYLKLRQRRGGRLTLNSNINLSNRSKWAAPRQCELNRMLSFRRRCKKFFLHREYESIFVSNNTLAQCWTYLSMCKCIYGVEDSVNWQIICGDSHCGSNSKNIIRLWAEWGGWVVCRKHVQIYFHYNTQVVFQVPTRARNEKWIVRIYFNNTIYVCVCVLGGYALKYNNMKLEVLSGWLNI